MCVCTYMYTLHHQKQKQKPRRSSGPKRPRYIKVPGINKVKVINYINKTKSKNFIGLNIDKKKQIIKLVRLFTCLWSVDTTFII